MTRQVDLADGTSSATAPTATSVPTDAESVVFDPTGTDFSSIDLQALGEETDDRLTALEGANFDTFLGYWNATTNSPSLSSGGGGGLVEGQYYVVSTAGTTTLDGISEWGVTDEVFFDGSVWKKRDNSDLVLSVAGKTGTVTLNGGDIANTPAGNISSTTVQTAIDELDTEKLAATHAGTGGSAHANATTSVAGFMSASDKTKLDGVASGATANSSDAVLLARANHTGTQALATISDVTITATNLNILDDGADTTLHFHAADRARANHTGSQTLSTISDVTITATNMNILDDGADTTLHFHAADRARANHTGSQALSTISDVSITATNLNILDDGADTTLHFHAADRARANHTGTQILTTISDVTITATNLNILDDGANTTLHFHDADRARANHTGTQTASTISDFASTVRSTTLSGYTTGSNTAITSSSTVLSAFQDLQAQVSAFTGGGSSASWAILSEIQANTVQGGTFTLGAWRTRQLNTEVDTSGIVSLSSSQFVLGAGTYIMFGWATAYNVFDHQTRIRNITDSTTPIAGSSERVDTEASNCSRFAGQTIISGTKTFELQHQCSVTKATSGLGNSADFGENEVYASLVIIKVA